MRSCYHCGRRIPRGKAKGKKGVEKNNSTEQAATFNPGTAKQSLQRTF